MGLHADATSDAGSPNDIGTSPGVNELYSTVDKSTKSPKKCTLPFSSSADTAQLESEYQEVRACGQPRFFLPFYYYLVLRPASSR